MSPCPNQVDVHHHVATSKLGEEVGYQVRFKKVVGPNTRIRFVTEAIFLRQILKDPELKGVGAVVFDEGPGCVV